MILNKYAKQPSEHKDYDITYGDWLGGTGDTLDVIETFVDCLTSPDDVALQITLVQNTLNTVKLWVGGGTSGQQYKVTIRVTTSGGRIDESELVFNVKEI